MPISRPKDRETRAPLRRKPKILEDPPMVFDTVPAAAGQVLLRARAQERQEAARPGRGEPATGVTDDEPTLVSADEVGEDGGGSAVRARAREIARLLAVPRPRAAPSGRRGVGDLTTVPYRGSSDDIDLDRTIEVLAERPVPEEEDILVRDRVREPRTVVLAVDVSGSMRGERALTAAATVGALTAELARDALGVIAFWSDAAVLLSPGAPVRPDDVLDALVALPNRGLTNVAFPLDVAALELARAPVRDARVVLLSDCVHNAGPDPRALAARLPRLDVLLDTTGEKDVDLGRELARIGRGTLHLVRDHHDVPPALTRVFRD